MLLFERFLKAINRLVPPVALSSEDVKRLEELNPEKFYIEDVQTLLGISAWQAKLICESGVRQRVFDRYVEVQCPIQNLKSRFYRLHDI